MIDDPLDRPYHPKTVKGATNFIQQCDAVSNSVAPTKGRFDDVDLGNSMERRINIFKQAMADAITQMIEDTPTIGDLKVTQLLELLKGK